jgi:hypothetical protein
MEEFTATSLARLLGICPSNISDWIRDGKLSSQILGNRHRILKSNVISMATKYPHHFHRAPDAALELLFDKDLIDSIRNASPTTERIKKITKIKRIKFLPTGVEYDSVKLAAIALECSDSAIRYHLGNKTSKLWKKIE